MDLPCNYLKYSLLINLWTLCKEEIKGRKELTESSTPYSSAICHCQNSPQIKFSNRVWNNSNRFSIVSLSQIQSFFFFFTRLLFYYVSKKYWVIKYQIIARRQSSELSHYEPVVAIYSSTDQYITLLYVCFFLKAPYLIMLPIDIKIKLKASNTIIMPGCLCIFSPLGTSQ